jgi:hypothetical protein
LELNLKVPSDKWTQTPSGDELDMVSSLPDSILLHPIDPIPPTALTQPSQKIPAVYRVIFLRDLEKSNFPGWTFAWDQPWEIQWNQLLSKFILKHWNNASQAGAFKAFHIDPTQTSDETLRKGILHRWFLGRKDGLRLGRFSDKRRDEKKQSEKKSKFRLQVRLFSKFNLMKAFTDTTHHTHFQLQKHRQETLSKLSLSLNEMELFDNIKCSSETEALPGRPLKRIPLPWRSTDFHTLSRQLDEIQIQKTYNTQGRQFLCSFSL